MSFKTILLYNAHLNNLLSVSIEFTSNIFFLLWVLMLYELQLFACQSTISFFMALHIFDLYTTKMRWMALRSMSQQRCTRKYTCNMSKQYWKITITFIVYNWYGFIYFNNEKQVIKSRKENEHLLLCVYLSEFSFVHLLSTLKYIQLTFFILNKNFKVFIFLFMKFNEYDYLPFH